MASTDDSASSASIPNIPLYDSQLTIPSDSETYPEDDIDRAPEDEIDDDDDVDGKDNNNNNSRAPRRPTSGPLTTTTQISPIWVIVRSGAINFIMPFVNGLMLGFGELVAHEFAFRWGWTTTKVFPSHRKPPAPAGL